MTAPRAARVETPAAVLRRASARVRELAAEVPDVEFHGLPLWDVVVPMVGNSRLNAVSLAPASEWIAALNPAVAEPLAAWLHWASRCADRPDAETETALAIALARALLGVPVPEPDGEGTR